MYGTLDTIENVRAMPDVAVHEPGGAAGKLDWVGMAGIEVPVRFDGGDGVVQGASARVDAFVDLERPHQRGIHMSRLYLGVAETFAAAPLGVAMLRTVLERFRESQRGAAGSARVKVTFEHLVERRALSSANHGWRAYPITVAAQLAGNQLAVELETRVLYSSTCPASAALARQLVQEQFAADFANGAPLDRAAVLAWLGSERGMAATPHAQRSMARVRVRLAPGAELRWLPLLDTVEGVLGTPVQTAVKREDEQAFAHANGANLMFCEDAARRIRHALDGHPEYADFHLRVEHRESLHPHDAVAYASKTGDTAAD